MDVVEQVEEGRKVGFFVLKKDCHTGIVYVDVCGEVVDAGSSKESFAERAEGEEEGLGCCGVGINVLCSDCWGGGVTRVRTQVAGGDEVGVFILDFIKEELLRRRVQKPGEDVECEREEREKDIDCCLLCVAF